jgi:hypothetical protein
MYGYGYQYGTTLLGGSLSTAIFSAYKTRVLADGGVVENDACAIAFLESIGAGTDIIPLFDADYQSVLDYGTAQGYTLPSGGQQTLQNDLVVALKAAGVWSKLDTFANFATDGDSDFALIDWIRLTDYTAVNSPTFTSNQGYQFNGTSSYINTNFNPLTSGTNYTLNNASRGFYLYNSIASPLGIDGNTITFDNGIFRLDGTANIRINSTNNINTNYSFGVSSGFKSINRTSSTNVTLLSPIFIDAATNERTQTSTSITSQNQLLGRSGTFYGNFTPSCYFMGASLVSENTDFVNAYDTYLTSI